MSSLLISWYGDDLTGSTDVLEALHMLGIPGVLFTRIPDADQLARFAQVRAIGLAGTSRSETPAWMDEHLPEAFRFLKKLDVPICHYKVCSTFDSAPGLGSIGRALELGRATFGDKAVPIVVGAPELGRYTSFGHLFARYSGRVYRIDRHPVMSRHPTTPMQESDLVLHLAAQTHVTIGHVDQVTLAKAGGIAAADIALAENDAVLLDVADVASQKAVGRVLNWASRNGVRFVIGSSGVEYALGHVWGGGASAMAKVRPPEAVGPIAVVSGSVSPTTERQVLAAQQAGFECMAIDPTAFFREGGEQEVERIRAAALAALADGRSVIAHTALGPATDIGNRLTDAGNMRHAIGAGLGRLLAELVRDAKLRRVVVAGGDTSSHAINEMAIIALTIRQPLPATPGSPLCVAHGGHGAMDSLQIAFKGGQIGGDDYFVNMRDGSR